MEGAADLGCIRDGSVVVNTTHRLDPRLIQMIENSSEFGRPAPAPLAANASDNNSAPPDTNATPPNGTEDMPPLDEECLPLLQSATEMHYAHGTDGYQGHYFDFKFKTAGTRGNYLTLWPGYPFFWWSHPNGVASHGPYSPGPWQELEVQKVGGSAFDVVRYGDTVTIGTRSIHININTATGLMYFAAKGNGDLTVNSYNTDAPETKFKLVNRDNPASTAAIPPNGQVAFQTSSGLYLAAHHSRSTNLGLSGLTDVAVFEMSYGVPGYWSDVGERVTLVHEEGDTQYGLSRSGNGWAFFGEGEKSWAIHRTDMDRPLRCAEKVMLRSAAGGLLTAHESGGVSAYQTSEGSHQWWYVDCKERGWGEKVQLGTQVGLQNQQFRSYLQAADHWTGPKVVQHEKRSSIGEWETWIIRP